jgi:hypothetical protein
MTSQKTHRIPPRLLCVAVLTVALAASSGTALAAPSLDGRAFGLNVLSPIVVPPTPVVTLPPTGGNQTSSLATVSASVGSLGTLTASALNVQTQGSQSPPSVASSATVASLTIGSGPLAPVAATAIHSECLANESGTTASTTIASLKVLGVNVNTSVAPNTTVAVGSLATLILNEQITDPGTGTVTVNAIHVKVAGGLAEAIVAQSRCGPKLVPPPVVPEVPLLPLLPLSAAGVLAVTGWLRWRQPGSVAVS